MNLFKGFFTKGKIAKIAEGIMQMLDARPVYAWKFVPGGAIKAKLEKEGPDQVLFTFLDLSEENAATMGITNPQHQNEAFIAYLLADDWKFSFNRFEDIPSNALDPRK
jgi:hypothetical protein